MNLFKKQIDRLISELKEISVVVDLLKRERDILAEQNVDLRRKLKQLQPAGRSEWKIKPRKENKS